MLLTIGTKLTFNILSRFRYGALLGGSLQLDQTSCAVFVLSFMVTKVLGRCFETTQASIQLAREKVLCHTLLGALLFQSGYENRNQIPGLDLGHRPI